MQGESVIIVSGRDHWWQYDLALVTLGAPPSCLTAEQRKLDDCRAFGALRRELREHTIGGTAQTLTHSSGHDPRHFSSCTIHSRECGWEHVSANSCVYRPSRRSPTPSRTSQNGTSTARPLARPQATTPMSTSALLRCTQTRSAAGTTSSSWPRPGCPMANPTHTTSAPTPTS